MPAGTSPPLGSAPGYGGQSEGDVGSQGPTDRERATNDATPGERQPSGAPSTPLFKEELAPDEKGTSLDEGGSG
jgi:hypothetical protein